MQNKFNFIWSFIITLLLAGLQGCSGGGSSSANQNSINNTPTVPTQSGSVSANFATNGNTPKYYITNQLTGVTVFGSTSNIIQQLGAVNTLGAYALGGTTPVTQNIAGDASFAMGRWVWGDVTSIPSGTLLDKMDGTVLNDSWHYLLTNTLSGYPANGTVMTCDNGVFTTPTSPSAGNVAAVASGSNATLSFSASGATFGFSLTTNLTTTSAISIGTRVYSVANLALNTATIQGAYPSGSGAMISLGAGEANSIRINGVYSQVLPNTYIYRGAYSFKCV